MPKVDKQELLELETEIVEDESPYMSVSDETWRRWQVEDRRQAEDEVYHCYLCRDSGMGKHPKVYCSCRYGVNLSAVDEWNEYIYCGDDGY